MQLLVFLFQFSDFVSLFVQLLLHVLDVLNHLVDFLDFLLIKFSHFQKVQLGQFG